MTTIRRTAGRTALALLALATLGSGCTGGGESVISGMGNSGNTIGTAAVWDALAHEFADRELAQVTDEEIARAFETIRRQAIDGNLEAALVVLKVAKEQREAE